MYNSITITPLQQPTYITMIVLSYNMNINIPRYQPMISYVYIFVVVDDSMVQYENIIMNCESMVDG